MAPTTSISRPIVEALYNEALTLADEVRAAFDLMPAPDGAADNEGDRIRIALSIEGLRTTTRIMHVLAWLLNQRAYFSGEMSEFQLRRHGSLPPDRKPEPEQMALLEPATRGLIEDTVRLHGRVARLDKAWRDRFEMEPPAISRLRERLGHAFNRF